jgi:RNA polymerase sigma factor (TIGR02999 family)
VDHPPPLRGDVTQLLEEFTAGNKEALSSLLPLIYDELRRLAAYYLHRERPNHTLQATALVHEAYLRLVNQRAVRWQNRSHFFGVAAQAMRRILVDHARAYGATKRGSGEHKLPLDEASAVGVSQSFDVLALNEALDRLATFDEQQVRVVELRFFAGFSVEETAEILGVSPATVKREWAMARAWLKREIGNAAPLPRE